jgi:hypothetical protein
MVVVPEIAATAALTVTIRVPKLVQPELVSA